MQFKYYFKGRLNSVVHMTRRYALKSNLFLLLLFHPRWYDKIKKYKEFKEFIKFAEKPKIKLYLLRKRPFFTYKNKKFYLRSKGLSIEIIKLLINSKLGIWHFSKSEIGRIKYKMKLPTIKVESEIILDANVYIDFEEAMLAHRLNDMRRFKKLFKSLPWGLHYHQDETINGIIESFISLKI